MPSIRAWLRSAWEELWLEIPQAWVWLALCITFPWVILSYLGLSTLACAGIAVPVGAVAWALTWARPR